MRKMMTLASVMALALPGVASAAAVASGPFVVSPVMLNTKSASVTVSWLEKGSDVTVQQGSERQTSAPLDVKHVTFAHLKPDTVYSYDTVAGKGSFHTPPMQDKPFEFLVYADARNGNVSNTIKQNDNTDGDMAHQRLVQQMTKDNPDFILHLGDMVQTGPDQDAWTTFFSIEKPLLAKAPMLLVYGNHEANAPLVHQIYNQPSTYYSFDWGDSHFIVLDSEIDRVRLAQEGHSMKSEMDGLWNRETQWFKEELETNKRKKHIFVCFHLPAFTATGYKRRDRSFRVQQDWVPLVEQYHATVINGHEHNYQHNVNNGIDYFVEGGAGASLEKVDWPLPGVTKKALAAYSYMRVRVNGEKIHVDVIGPDGQQLDTIDTQ
jgi:acid phosphatase type 7